MQTRSTPSSRLPGNKATYLLVAVWTVLVFISLITQREQLNRTASALARIDAIANLKKDMTIRQWASGVGGVFIREEHVPSTNSLEEEERVTLTRSNGEILRLVSVTPIHLLLAIQGASNRANGKEESGIRERLTSKQLRNLDNAPDDWEATALEALNKGGDMVAEALPRKGGHGLMRVMIPMRMEKECLECHRDTLVPVGGLRGGASVSINLNAYRTAQEPTWLAIQYWHFGIWLLGLTGIYAFAFLTRRRNIEKRRREEERRENETAFAAMAEGAIITDAKGSILWVNDAFCRISGYGRDEVIDRNPRFLKSGAHDEAFYRQLWQQLTSSGHWRGELWNKRKSGEIFPEEISIQALRGADGRIRRYISILSDITERKRNERELQEYREHLEELVRQRTGELTVARDEAEAANRSKTTFLANMSHELRTPLNAVIGFSLLMDKDRDLAPKQRRNAEIINRSGNHLLTLINDILELSKIESGKMEMNAQEVDLAELLEQVVDMMRQRAEQAGISLALEAEGLPEAVVLDPVMLRQVLINLLSNAVKFTAVSPVRLVYPIPAQGVSLKANGVDAGGGMVRLTFGVADTGIGIPVEDLARIFQPFEQAGGSPREGTGLGLTISQQYVRMLGGELVVESEVGKGAVFSFSVTVPAPRLPQAKLARRLVTGVEPAAHGKRILVVDDLPEARLLVRSLLEPLGFGIIEASTAAEAEHAVECGGSGLADLVLMDWFLPDGNGLDAIERIRARKDIRQPRIAMLTANALEESRHAALAAGADDFLSKPYEESALYAMLEKHLSIRFALGTETGAGQSQVVPGRGIVAAGLLGLAPETRTLLAEAAVSLDRQRIAGALLAVADENRELASRLAEFSDTRQYQALWELLGIMDGEEEP
ncbi:MAG: PAS domain S-box protein [Betaproteobacteria bacterium]|nr:PAS domain S-box protein [Betaproteobacteria bacterium]